MSLQTVLSWLMVRPTCRFLVDSMLQAYLPNVEAVYTSPEAYHAVSCPFSCRRVRSRQVKNCFAQTDKALRDSRIYEHSGVGFSSLESFGL